MHNRIAYITIILLFTGVPGVVSQILQGIVMVKGTNQPVPFAVVTERISGKNTLSDESGCFNLNLPGQVTAELKINHLTFLTERMTDISVRKNTQLKVYLTPSVHTMEDVTIMGLSPLRTFADRTYSVTRISPVVIEESVASTLADLLERTAGIYKSSEYFSPLNLRGLGGKRMLVVKNGHRRMGNFQDGFMGHGVNVYDLSGIEVVRGPSSLSYGPGAIAGIIYMKGKSPLLTPGIHGRVLSSLGTGNMEGNIMADVNWGNNLHGISVSGRMNGAGDFRYGGGAIAQNSHYRNQDARISYTHDNRRGFSLNLSSDLHLGGPWGRPVGFNGTRYMRLRNLEDNTWHTSLNAGWSPDEGSSRMELSVYRDQENRLQLSDYYDAGSRALSYRKEVAYRNAYTGWRAVVVEKDARGYELSFGTDGVVYRIQSPTVLTDYFLSTRLVNQVAVDAGVSSGALFTEGEYHLPDSRLKIRGGLRADMSVIHEGRIHDTLNTKGRKPELFSWNGLAGFIYEPAENLYLSFQMARSSRMPDAGELFMTTSGTDGIVNGNPSLKPEKGLNLDAGIRGSTGDRYVDFSLYSNFLYDFISMEYDSQPGNRGIHYSFFNVERARIMGVELSLGGTVLSMNDNSVRVVYHSTAALSHGDKLAAGNSWFSAGTPLRRIIPFNTRQDISLRIAFSGKAKGYTGLEMKYQAALSRIAPSAEGGYPSPSSLLAGVYAGYGIKAGKFVWDARLSISNLTDRNYLPFESLIPGMGRNLKLLVSMSF